MTSRKEKLIVGAENQGGDLFGVTFKGGFNGCVSGINNFDGIAARTYDEGAVGWDDVGATGVELLKSRNTAVVGFQAKRLHFGIGAQRNCVCESKLVEGEVGFGFQGFGWWFGFLFFTYFIITMMVFSSVFFILRNNGGLSNFRLWKNNLFMYYAVFFLD